MSAGTIETVSSPLVPLDQAAILSIISCIPDAREKARLSTLSRLWHECVRTAWTSIDLSMARVSEDGQKIRHWLSKQLPYSPRALQDLHLGFASVYFASPAVALLREVARFEGLQHLHLVLQEPLSGLVVEQEDLQMLQGLQALQELSVVCRIRRSHIGNDDPAGKLCQPQSIWPLLKVLRLTVGTTSCTLTHGLCPWLEATLRGLLRLECMHLAGAAFNPPLELPKLKAVSLRSFAGVKFPLAAGNQLHSLTVQKLCSFPDPLPTFHSLREFTDFTCNPAWTAERVRARLTLLPMLERLHLDSYIPDAAGLAEFAALLALSHLNLGLGPNWTNGRIWLSPKLTRLRSLRLGNVLCPGLRELVLPDVLPGLELLDVWSATAPCLQASTPALTTLHIQDHGGYGCLYGGLDLLLGACQKLEHVSLTLARPPRIVPFNEVQQLHQCSALQELCLTVSWPSPLSRPARDVVIGDFEAATYLLGTLECMPALSCLSLVGMTLRMGLDLRHLCSLTHLALGAFSLCLTHAEPMHLPRCLRSVHLVSADAPDDVTLHRLQAEASLPLRRVCRENHIIYEGKHGAPHEHDVDLDNLDDLSTLGMHVD